MKYRSTTHYLLAALIPYTEANLKLTFLPSRFFYDLSRLDNIKETTLRSAFGRAVYQGLIVVDRDGIPRLTNKGLRKLAPYKAKNLKNAQVMVIFDIPEVDRRKRQQLRTMLREFSFKQVQRSVWSTSLDCIEYVAEEVRILNLRNKVQVYEARRIL